MDNEELIEEIKQIIDGYHDKELSSADAIHTIRTILTSPDSERVEWAKKQKELAESDGKINEDCIHYMGYGHDHHHCEIPKEDKIWKYVVDTCEGCKSYSPTIECPTCYGSGEIEIDCPQRIPLGESRTMVVKCPNPDCKGTGKILQLPTEES